MAFISLNRTFVPVNWLLMLLIMGPKIK